MTTQPVPDRDIDMRVVVPADQEVVTLRATLARVEEDLDSLSADFRRVQGNAIRRAARLDRIAALVVEYRQSVNPAPYTSERALIERLEAALAGSPAVDHEPG